MFIDRGVITAPHILSFLLSTFPKERSFPGGMGAHFQSGIKGVCGSETWQRLSAPTEKCQLLGNRPHGAPGTTPAGTSPRHSLAGEQLSGLDSGRDGEGLWFGNTDSIFLEVFNKKQVVDEH